jgi:hypothetical protein
MRRLWLGMLLACLPVGLVAQNQDRWGSGDDSITAAPLPPLPTLPSLPSLPPPTPDGQVTQAPSDDPNAPEVPDNTVTASPLPPPDQEVRPDQSDSTEQLVPNPLDGPAPAPGTTRQAQPQGQPQRGGWVQMGSATLQALDKVNARSSAIAVKVGDSGHFGSLDIAVRGCFVRTADRPTDATAFLVIRDQHPDSPSFTGWMVRSAPYMSMLAHPIYDIRVTGCSQ